MEELAVITGIADDTSTNVDIACQGRMLPRIPVSSSDLRSVGYDASSKRLEIEFRTGSVYEYVGVPLSVYEGLMRAGSKGGYFHTYVKDRYPTRRIG